MTHTPAEIAARLTKAQREALLSDHWQDWRPLLRVGLVYWGQNFIGNGKRLKMRPDFLAVRELLKGHDDD
jgi:hypothetical protein